MLPLGTVTINFYYMKDSIDKVINQWHHAKCQWMRLGPITIVQIQNRLAGRNIGLEQWQL
jgi:hypothetical protein